LIRTFGGGRGHICIYETHLDEPVGALDLSGTRDLTALALWWTGDTWHAMVEFWTPKDTLVERSKRDRVPYDVWVDQGHITATPGRAVDYGFVAQRLAELQQEVGLRRIAFDPYRIKYLEKELDEQGIELELVAARPGLLQGGGFRPVDAAFHRGP
jgi:phage terminase large subunit-like protein